MAYIGDQRTQAQIDSDYRLKAVLSNGAVWNNGANAYVLNGKIYSTVPQFAPKDDPTSLSNVDPASVQASLAKGSTVQKAINDGTVKSSSNTATASNSVSAGSSAKVPNTLSGLSSLSSSGSFSIDDLMNMLNDNYTGLSDNEIMKLAAAQINPSYNSQLTNIANEEEAVNARYAALLSALDNSLTKTEGTAQKALTARGLGDSGLVSYEKNKLDTNIAGQITSLQGQQQSELSGLSNQRTTLQGSRASLLAASAQQIRDNQRSDQTAALSAKIPLINTILDKTNADMNTLVNAKTEATTNMGYVSGGDDMLGLRATGGSKVGYDGTNATVNGIPYTNAQLTSMGGELRDGSWYLPKKALTALGIM